MNLIHFVKNRKGQINGAVVAIGRGQVGFSLCMDTDMHKFTKARAVEIAIQRATIYHESLKVPHSIRRVFESVVERSNRYFK